MLGQLSITALRDVEHSQIISMFRRIQHKPWACLLDSCEQTKIGARYDIVAHTPSLNYQFINNEHVLGGDSKAAFTLIDAVCPFAQIDALHEQFLALIDTSHIDFEAVKELPFLIGALAAFSYDVNIYTDNIKDQNPNQYSLADISLGFYSNALIYDNIDRVAYICSVCDETKNRYISAINEVTKAHVRPEFNLTAPWCSNFSKSEYTQQFNRIEDYLVAGDCYQVNFAQRFKASFQGSEFTAYEKLREINQAPFSAFMRLPESCLLSLSPERFLLVRDDLVETKPIKGTRKRSSDPQLDKQLADELVSAEKDRAENLMIVDLLRNDISKHCQPHSVDVPKLFALESYPAVHHMVSTVIGKLKPTSSVYDLLKGAFPGGSITGAPKVRAMQVIQELEADKRAIYCGSIGYIGIRHDMDTNICIRTLLAENNTLYCWAGGGIVIDSNAPDEYQESLYKVAKILPYLSPTIESNVENENTP